MTSMQFDVLVEVRLRPGISDPQGATIERALPALGFGGISAVSVGKAIRVTVEAADAATARVRIQALCDRFLTNPVIEDASISVEPAAIAGVAGDPRPATDSPSSVADAPASAARS